MENHSPNNWHVGSEAEKLACEFARRVEHAVEGLQQLLDITSDNDGWHDHAVRHLLLALLNLPHVRITLVTASLGREEFLSTQFGSAIAAQVELQLDQLCGGDESPWTLNKVEVTDEHRFARWQDVQESRTAGIAGCDDDQETRVVDVAVFMISNGRWPERVLQPVLESILVHCDPEHQPEVVAVLCDRSSQRLQLDCRLLDLQCTHIRSRKTKWTVGSEKNRDDLCREVASWGTLHCAADRDTNGGLVMVLMLPLRFPERLLVLAALIRAVYDTSYIVATPGPWIETLIEIWLPKLIELCVIDSITCTVSWLDAQESYRKFGIRAHQFSDGERLSFDASSFDALTPYGPGAAERLVGCMARLGIIYMQHLALSLTLSDIALFGSYTHGVRIVGSCPEHFVARRGIGCHDVPAFLPEILDVIGARLLNRYLLSKNNRLQLGAPGNDPVITTWHHIWALLRETIVSLAQGRGSALLRQRLFAIFMNTTRAKLRDILCKVSKIEGQQTPPPWRYKPDFCLAEEDISSAPALPVEASISHPHENEGILCELVLDVDFGLTIGAEESFKRAIALDLARAAGGNVDQIKVLRLRAGSVIVELMLCRGLQGRSPIDTFYFLKKQEKTHGSLLLQGEVTRKTQELRIKRGEPSHRSVTNEKPIRGRNGTLGYCEADSGIPVQVSDKSDETRQDCPPPGEEPGLEGLRLISRQTVCYIRGTEEQVRECFSHPQLSVCCCDLIPVDDDPEAVRRDLEVYSRGVAVQLSAVETQTQSFVDAVSFAIRGCQDEDGIVCEGLEVASSHADSYVGRQWAHRNTEASKAICSSLPTHSFAPNLFTSPVTVASMRQETANVFEDDESHNSENRRVWAHKVYPLHLLITANTLRRPVIVLEPESFSSRPAEQVDSTSLKGVYLPLSCSPDTCIADPIVLLHKPNGFDLAGVKDQEVRWIQTLSAVCLPPRNIESDQWFAPIIPQLPDEGDSVPIVMKETLPLHYFLEDEGQEETLRMYLCSLSVEIADGQIRRIIRYPILQPVCTNEVFAKHKNIHIAGPESTATAKDVCTVAAKDGIIPGTISGVLAHHAGRETLPPVTAFSDAQDSWKLSNWLHLQWFSMLWTRDHPDADAGAHVMGKSNSAYEIDLQKGAMQPMGMQYRQAEAEAAAQKKYAHAKAAWAKKQEEMAAAKKKYEADVAEKKKKDPKYDETVDRKNNDDALAAVKKKNDDALAAAEKQLAVETGAAKAMQPAGMQYTQAERKKGTENKERLKYLDLHLPHFSFPAITGPDLPRFDFPKRSCLNRIVDEEAKVDRSDRHSNRGRALHVDEKDGIKILCAEEGIELVRNSYVGPCGENEARPHPHFSFPAITGPDLQRFDFPKRSSLNRMVNEHFVMDGSYKHFKGGAGISECSFFAGDKDVEIEDLKERIKAAEARLRSLGVEGETADLRYVDPPSKGAAWNNMFNLPKMNLNLHLPGMPKLKFPSWQSDSTGERPSDASATQMNSKDEEEDRDTAQGEAVATRRVWGRPRGGIMGVTQFDKEGRPSGCLGFSMKAKTPPETDRYSVIIDKVTPGTSASIAGEVAVNDEILEIHGQDVKDLYDDFPDADALMSRINAKLAESTDFVTIKVLQEDGLINSFRLLRAENILPNIQHLPDGETGVELEASGKHVVIKRILDGSPAFFSFVLATGQRVLSINFQRSDVKYLEEYEELRFGTVGTRVTYVVDTRTEYPDDDDHQYNLGIAKSAQWAKLPSVVSWNTTGRLPRTTDGYIVETEDQKGAREDEEWVSIIDDAKPLMLPLVRQVLMNNQERKMVETFRKANSPFFLTARGGPDFTALKKLIVKAKPRPIEPPPPKKPMEREPPLPPPPKKEAPPKKPRAPPPKKEAPPRRTPPPAPTKKVPPPPQTPLPPYDHLRVGSIPHQLAKKVAPSPPKRPPAPTKKTAPSPKSPPPPYDHLSMVSIPQPPAKKVAPLPPTPKSVGIGMKIGMSCPHAVTGFAKGGASAECGLIFEGDKLLQVDGNDVKDVSMDECSKYILGPEGSEIQLKFLRLQPPPPPRPVKKIDPPKMVGVGLMLEIKKTKNGALVHFVGGVAPGAAAESGQIAVGDLLVVVNGKDCSKLDGKQVQAIVLGLEGSPITMEFVRGNPEVATPRSDNERFQVDLIRGGSEYKKRLEDGETAYNKMIEQYEKQYPPAEPELVEVKLFRGGSEGKKRVQAELEAHRKLVQSVEEENMQAEAAYKRKLEEEDKAYKILVERIEEENLQADATHKKKIDDNQNTYKKLVERIEEENAQAEAAYKRKLEEEDKAYKILVERIEEENLQADAAHKKKIDDNQNTYMKLVERIEEENAQAEAAYKKKLEGEEIAYKRLVQRFDEENVKADAAHKQKLQDEDAAYQKLLEDIEKENQQAEAAFSRSLESDDEEYKQLVKRVEEENQMAEETYKKELEAKQAAYQRKIQEDEAAYKRQLEEIEEENRLEIAWWEYGSDIDPPRKGQTDIEVILDLDIKDIVGEFECEEDVKQISLEYFHGVQVLDKTQKALLDDFKRQLCAELAEICKAHEDEMKVVDLQKGSIISRIRLQENVGKVIGKSAAGVAQDLCKQAEFDWQTRFSGLSGMLRSKLYTGKLGSKVISIRVLPDGKPLQRPLKPPGHPGIMDGAMGSLISWKDGAIGFRSVADQAGEIKDSARSSLSSVQTGTGGLGLSDAQSIQSNPGSGLLESVAASVKMPFVFGGSGGSEKEELKGTTLNQGGRLFGISNGSMTNPKSDGEQGQLELQESAKSGALGGFWGSMKSQTAGIFGGGTKNSDSKELAGAAAAAEKLSSHVSTPSFSLGLSSVSTTTASAGPGWAALPSVVSWNTGGRVPVSTYNLKRDNQAEMSTPASEVLSGPIQSNPEGGRVLVSTYNLKRDNQAEMSTPAGEVLSGPIQSNPEGGRVPVSTYNLKRDNQAEMSMPAGEVLSGPIQSNPGSGLLESVAASVKMPFVFGGSGGSEKEELKGTTLNQGGRLFGISNGSMTNPKSDGEQGQLELQESAKSGALGGFWGSMKSQTAGIFGGGTKNSDSKELAGAAAAAEKLSSHVSTPSFSLGLSSVSTTTASAGPGWAALPSVVSWNTGGRVPVSTYNLKRDNQAEMSTPAGEVLSGPIQSNPGSGLLESVAASVKMPFVFGGSGGISGATRFPQPGTTLNQGGRLFGISNGAMPNPKSDGEQGQLELQESAKSGALGGFWGSMKSQTAGIFGGGTKNSDSKELAGAAAAAEKLSSHVSTPSFSFPLFPVANKEGVRGTQTQSDTGSDVRFGMSDTQAGTTPCLHAAEGVEIHSTSATSSERRKVEDHLDNSGYSFVQRKDKQNRASRLVKREHQGLPFHPETLEFLPGNLEKMPDRLAECAGSTDRNTTVELAFLMGCLPDICSINRDQRLRIDKDTRLQPDFSRLPMCYLETVGFISTRHEERMPERPENPMAFMQDLEVTNYHSALHEKTPFYDVK